MLSEYLRLNNEVLLLGLFDLPEKKLSNYINEISSGDQAALEEFYSLYGRTIYAIICSYVRSRESAEEVLQDVLMSIVMYGANNPITKPKSWLFSVIRNASVKRAEEDKKRQNEYLSEDSDTIPDSIVLEMVEDSVDQIQALHCLDDTERKCVLLCAVGGLKLPAVAEALELPYDRVRNIYYYALKKLRKYYEKEQMHERPKSSQTAVE